MEKEIAEKVLREIKEKYCLINKQEKLLAKAYELLTEWSEEGESEEVLEELYKTVEQLKEEGYKF